MSQPAQRVKRNFCMLLIWFWLSTIIKQRKLEHYINLQMDQLGNQLTTSQILTGWEMSVEPYPNRRLGWIADLHRVFDDGLVPTQSQTRNGGPEPLLPLVMSERPNCWMLQLLETTARGVDTSGRCNGHSLCLWFFSVAHIHSRFVIARASGFGMRVGRISKPLRGVGVLAMPDAGLDSSQCIESVCEVTLGAGVLQQLEPSMEVGVFVDCHCLVDGVDVTRCEISGTQELFCKDEAVKSWPWIVEVTELCPWDESLSPAGMATNHLPEGSVGFPQGQDYCSSWRLARLQTFRMTRVVSRWALGEGIVRSRYPTFRM